MPLPSFLSSFPSFEPLPSFTVIFSLFLLPPHCHLLQTNHALLSASCLSLGCGVLATQIVHSSSAVALHSSLLLLHAFFPQQHPAPRGVHTVTQHGKVRVSLLVRLFPRHLNGDSRLAQRCSFRLSVGPLLSSTTTVAVPEIVVCP